MNAVSSPTPANASKESARRLKSMHTFIRTGFASNEHRGGDIDVLEPLVEAIRGAGSTAFNVVGAQVRNLHRGKNSVTGFMRPVKKTTDTGELSKSILPSEILRRNSRFDPEADEKKPEKYARLIYESIPICLRKSRKSTSCAPNE